MNSSQMKEPTSSLRHKPTIHRHRMPGDKGYRVRTQPHHGSPAPESLPKGLTLLPVVRVVSLLGAVRTAMSASVAVERGKRKVTWRVSYAKLFRRFWLKNLERVFASP